MRMRNRAAYMWLRSGMRQGLSTMVPVERKGISKRKCADRMRKMRGGTLKTQVCQGGWPADEEAWVACGCVSVMGSAM